MFRNDMLLEARLRSESAAAFIGTVRIAYGRWIASGATNDPSPILRRCFAVLRDM